MPDVQPLVAALLHTLWQGPVIALALAALLAALPARQAGLRYTASLAALAILVGAFFLTWNLPTSRTGALLSPTPNHAVENIAAEPTTTAATTGTANPTGGGVYFSGYELALLCWLLGATMMLVRLVIALKGVRALARTAFVVEDPGLSSLFEEMRTTLRAPARAAVRLSNAVLTPVAVGLIQPMVILPAAYATGLPPEHLRAMLAHELAHLRRHDYFVNLLQMLAEAAFYFNPALWWISRQIRIEREACCDLAAAAASGGAIAYSEALAEVARHASASGLPATALAMSEPIHGGLAERVRRLLAPTHRPHLRLPLPTFAVALAATVLLLFATYATAQVAARAVVSYLRLDDEERIEYLAAKEAQAPNYSPDDEYSINISGRLILPDGAELPPRNCDVVFVGHGKHSFCQTVCIAKSGNFGGNVHPAITYLQVTLAGFEPVNAGPFHPDSENRIEGIEIPLVKATPARLRLVDEENNPVAGAKVSGHYKFFKDMGCGGVGKLESDSEGIVLLDQAAEPVPVDLKIEAPGCQMTRVERLIAPAGAESVIRLKKDRPVEVVLQKESDQNAIEDAEFYLLRAGNYGYSYDDPYPSESQGNGHFVLNGLDREAESIFAVRSPTVGGTYFRLPAEASAGPVVVSIPETYVRGTIIGDLESLKDGDGDISLRYQGETRGDEFNLGYFQYERGDIAVEVKEGVGHFELAGLLPGVIYLSISKDKFETITVKGPTEGIVIELDATPEVVVAEAAFILTTPPGMPSANGYLTLLDYVVKRQDAMGEIRISITDGRGSGTLPFGIPLYCSLEGIPGYTFDQERFTASKTVNFGAPVDTVPRELTIKLQPAGAISGVVASANGVPLSDEWIFLSQKGTTPDREDMVTSLQTDDKGAFNIPGVPFDNEYIVKMQHWGDEYVQEVSLSAAKPVAEVKFTTPAIAPQRAVTVRVVDPKGEPVRNYRVKASAGLGGLHHCKSPSGIQDLAKVDAGVPVQIHVAPERGFQPASAEIAPDQTEVTITAQPGRTARGQVVDDATGEPREGITVFVAFDNGISSDTVTDSAGNFQFTNLPDTPVKAYIDVGKSFGVDLVSGPVTLPLDGVAVLRVAP